MQKNICVSLGDKLMAAFEENKLLKTMNRSALVREAVADYIKRNLQSESKNEEGRK